KAKEIIEASDRFGIVNLKLEAEACYVDTVELTLDNIVEVVTYADSKNLALLKEHCMDFLSSANKIEVTEKVPFDSIPSYLMKDLLVAQARCETKSNVSGDLGLMRVSELRKLAHDKGLGLGVPPAEPHQLIVRAAFDNPPGVHDDDRVAVLHRAQPVRDDHARRPAVPPDLL
ncbi:hypothetical protein THAOC_10033, partial [Thalassiosira oceanica]